MIITSEKSVGIIGGAGKTGSQFAALFAQQGFNVEVTGSGNVADNKKLLTEQDIILFAVPLRESVDIIQSEVQHAKRDDQLICDVSSLKAPQMEAMMQAPGEVIGLHPLFGPFTDVENQTIVLCPGRCEDETVSNLKDVLQDMGMNVRIMTAEAHDKLMAVLQVIPHLKSFLVADILAKLDADIDELMDTCTPAYSIELDLVGRFLDDSPNLYGPIMFANPETKHILELLKESVDTCLNYTNDVHGDSFTKHYSSLQNFFGKHCEEGRNHSEQCIRTLSSSQS